MRFLKSSDVISVCSIFLLFVVKIELISSNILIIGQNKYLIISNNKLEERAVFSGDENANSFGAISPKINSKMVITMISMIIRIDWEKCWRYFSPTSIAMSAAVEAAATFTIVFPKSMIISSSFGFLSNRNIRFELLFLLFSNFFNWIFDNEKKAVSDPEKKAESIKKPTIDTIEKLSFTSLILLLS